MFGVDDPTATATLPAAGPPETPGYFSNGNPALGVPGTIIPGWWLNMVQEELRAILIAAGVTPNKANNAQVLAAIQVLIKAAFDKTPLPIGNGGKFVKAATDGSTWVYRLPAEVLSDIGAAPVIHTHDYATSTHTHSNYADINHVHVMATIAETQAGIDTIRAVTPAGLAAVLSMTTPPGVVTAFAGTAAPTGWLKCNGALVSRTTYAALYAAIGATHGVGDGSTTFKLPDLRGEFVRGWDDGRGIDPGRSFGAWQKGTMGAVDTSGSGDGRIAVVLGCDTATPVAAYGFDPALAADYPGQLYGVGATYAYSTTALAGLWGSSRPRNVALLYCIKY